MPQATAQPQLSLAQFMDAFRAQAAAAQTVEYPINTALPRYNGVRICAAGGNYKPRGWIINNGIYSPNRDYLAAECDVYDPFFYCAPLNTDHEFYGGPAWGLVLNAYMQGDDQLVDLVNVDPFLAQQIDDGRWPARSKEWWDADNWLAWAQYWSAPGDPIPQVEEFYFYEKYHHYLDGLGLLGQVLPGVPALGPMPRREQPSEAGADTAALPEYLLAAASKPVLIPRLAASHGASRFVTQLIPITQEAEMPNGSPAPQGAQPGGGATAANNAASQDNHDPAATPAGTITAAQAQQLLADNERLIAANRDRDIRDALNSHLNAGRLTTQAQREAFNLLAAMHHGHPAPQATAAAQEPQVQTAQSALDLLNVIIGGFPPQVEIGAAAAGDTGSDRKPAGDDPAATARAKTIRSAIAARKEGKQ